MRHTKTVDGKIVKRKRKDKGKKPALSPKGGDLNNQVSVEGPEWTDKRKPQQFYVFFNS